MSGPTTMSRLGFLELSTYTDPKHARAITLARETAEKEVAQLRDHRRKEIDGDRRLSPEGKELDALDALKLAKKFTQANFDRARNEIMPARDAAVSTLGARMFAGVDTSGAKITQTADRIFQFIAQNPVPGKLPTDTSSGHALLLASGKALSTFSGLLASGPLEDAKLLVLAARRADPLTRLLLGGEPVLAAMTSALRDRVTIEDTQAGEAQIAIDAADALLSEVATDERHTVEGACRALGLPVAMATAIDQPDPIREAAGRKVSTADPIKDAARKTA